ncbi:MAG: sensor domain-containing diguanylate cyclase [Pseudomonadales bacterium]|nr:sensor domain-containing diguanylate cyclase [Pseudomonadales bacterium]
MSPKTQPTAQRVSLQPLNANSWRLTAACLLALFLTLFAASPAFSQAVTFSNTYSDAYVITSDTTNIAVDKRYYIFEDPSGSATIDDVLYRLDDRVWRLRDSSALEWKYSDSTFWYRIELDVKSIASTEFILDVASPFLDYVDFYHVIYDQFQEPFVYRHEVGGDQRDSSEKFVNARNAVFPVDLDSISHHTLILKVNTDSALILPMNLMERKTYQETENKVQAFYGLLFGFMVVMAIYNSVIWLFLREKTFLYYVSYVVFAVLYLVSMTGFGSLYLWDNIPFLEQYGISLFVSMAFFFGGLFVIHFLSLDSNAPKLAKLARFLMFVYAVFAVLSLVLPESMLVPILQPLGIVASSLVLWSGIYLWRRGSVWAKYLTISWSVLVFGTMTYTMMLLGFVERNPFTEYMQSVGFAIEVSLLSIALAARMNQERQAKRMAMETALDLARKVNTVNQEKLIIQRQANIELEEKVDRQTSELRQAMQKLSHANQQLEAISVKDQLTGLLNRRFFDDYFPNQYRNCSIMGKPISVMVIDIDYFKKINDFHGHLAGDECLKTIAKVISATNQREDDKIIRFGGEEFIMVLPNTDVEGANSVAERIREAVEKTLFVANGKRIPLTISVGVAAIVPDGEQPPESILLKADSALYEAKRSGRNCVRIA